MVISRSGYMVLLALIAAERCVELALSRRNAARAFARGGIEAGRSHYPLMVMLHVLFLTSCLAENLAHDSRLAPAVETLALAGVIAAQALRYWTVAAMGQRWNTRVIVIPGETPVIGGPFALIRHPNYLAVAIEIACLPLVRGLWITAAVFSIANAAMLRTRIGVEERALGDRYAAALGSQPRLIPRIPLLRSRANQ